MGIVLDQSFRRSVEQSISEKLVIQIYGLLSVAEVEQQLFMPESLQEPGFNLPGSGLGAIILGSSATELWRSPSGIDLMITDEMWSALQGDLSIGEQRFGEIKNGVDPYFYQSYQILWQSDEQVEVPLTFVVLESKQSFQAEVASYRNTLWFLLLGVSVVLLVVQAMVIRWGLVPLRYLARDLKQIEDGKQEILKGAYPDEIDGVTRNLNLLLSREREQREKYRLTMADLAHSLKTPLAIIRGSMNHIDAQNNERQSRLDTSVNRVSTDANLGLSESTNKTDLLESLAVHQAVNDQVTRMNEIIDYQLQRAVAGSSQIIKRPFEIKPVVESLVSAMQKVYAAKSIRFDLDVADTDFLGDERDLTEVLGNLVDNACKYGASVVSIKLCKVEDHQLLIKIEDDGPGIPLAQREAVLRRGQRLDSATPGQGIGLAIVVEIAARYGGAVTLMSKEDGCGTGVKVVLQG